MITISIWINSHVIRNLFMIGHTCHKIRQSIVTFVQYDKYFVLMKTSVKICK